MFSSTIQTTMGRVAMLAIAASLTGCTADYATGNSASVLLVIASINGGAPLAVDVRTGAEGSTVTAVSTTLDIAVRFKNPNISTVPQIPSAVIIERYEIKYRRSDGRGVEGQDVPYSISGNVQSTYDVKTSGTDPLTIQVIRSQAKIEAPLSNLKGYQTNTLGGSALVLTFFADITLHGRTISGQVVTATGSLQIDAADYAE